MSNPLRNPNIDYERGWFSVTVQVAHNKSVFGAIVGEVCELNELGRAVHEAWLSHPAHTPGLYIDEFRVMPNHFHAAVKLTPAPGAVAGGPRESGGDLIPPTAAGEGSRDGGGNLVAPYPLRRGAPHSGQGRGKGLSWVMGKFKSYSNHLYLEMQKACRCIDIGPRLWQSSFYDNLISSHEELENVRQYFRDNPKNWNHDRFGAVTTYGVGNAELLSCRLVAFVASEMPPARSGPAPTAVGRGPREWGAISEPTATAPGAISGPTVGRDCPVISTFTSPEEREVCAKCLRKKRPFVWVCPGGIWDPLPPAIAKACEEGWAFVCSPVPTGTRVNKQRAIWCNQYVIRQAASVWVGSIRPGGSLETLLKAIKGEERKNVG